MDNQKATVHGMGNVAIIIRNMHVATGVARDLS